MCQCTNPDCAEYQIAKDDTAIAAGADIVCGTCGEPCTRDGAT